jgi:DNA polymerase/3'-5' exonuclease PolX
MNEKLIDEFSKLLDFINIQTQQIKKEDPKDKKLKGNQFRAKQIATVITMLKNYPEKITIKNFNELGTLPGIGKNTIGRIKEIIETGKLEELDEFNKTYDNKLVKKKKKVIENLKEVVGIGPNKADELYDKGIKNVEDLKKKVEEGKIDVNEKIKLGLNYFGVYQTNIPRKEISEIKSKTIDKAVKKLNERYPEENNGINYIICGSYRREKPTSGDIDILLYNSNEDTKKKSDHKPYLEPFIDILKEGKNPFLLDDLTDKNYQTKYMGFCKYKKNPVRRIDVRFIKYKSYPYGILYFTGSMELNKKMREIAKNQGYKLSEYSLENIETGKKFIAKTEKEIFNKLGLDYIEPRLR